MKRKIALLGLWNINNYGDPVLAFCTKTLLQNAGLCGDSVDVIDFPLTPTSFQVSFFQRVKDSILYHFSKMIGKVDAVGLEIYRRRIFCHYLNNLKGVDSVVFVGGGIIKYGMEAFDCLIECVMAVAKINNFSVIMNAVGIEGYDENNVRCQQLKKALNQPQLRYISTRDDFLTLKNNYFDGKNTIPCRLVADPAVWSSECYGIKKNDSARTIGIGVARGEIFKDYGINFSSENMVDLYVDLTKLLLSSGYEVELFTNGRDADNSLLEQVSKRLMDFRVRQKVPSSARNLVEIIASYKAIVTTRMHAGIIAYSLDVPAIGLMWNDKIKFFWESAGHPEYCIDVAHLNPEDVFSALKNAVVNGYNQEHKRVFRQTIKDEIAKIATMLFQ